MIRILEDQTEKRRTRPLYEEIFREDGKGFVDYYYEDRCLDNVIFTDEETAPSGQTELVSMVHLNPYTVMLERHAVPAGYIFAVATKEAYRHQGRMARLLDSVFRYCFTRGDVFVFLIPVNTKIYEPFGFETICELQTDKTVPYETIRRDYDVYCMRDADYLRRLQTETALTKQGETQALPDHSVIMARIINEAWFRGMGYPSGNHAILDRLKTKRIFISEEV